MIIELSALWDQSRVPTKRAWQGRAETQGRGQGPSLSTCDLIVPMSEDYMDLVQTCFRKRETPVPKRVFNMSRVTELVN